jgi:very-short-patch-repair endonuclease
VKAASRRWTQSDVDALTHRQYGLVSTPPPALSPEAAAQRLARIRVTRRKLEALFEQHLTWTGLRHLFESQVKFHPERKWRLDYLCREFQLGVEIHGGVFSAGRHTTGQGFTQDRAKSNAAAELGITLLEFTGEMLSDGSAISQTERLLVQRGWKQP